MALDCQLRKGVERSEMWLYQRVIDFLGIGGILSMINSHQLTTDFLLSGQGIAAIVTPIFPVMLLLEVAFLAWVNRRSPRNMSAAYKIPGLIYVLNVIIRLFVSLEVLGLTHELVSKIALFEAPVRIRWFIYGYVIWELGHFVYHYTCHRVRILWCLHSPHHAPSHMNLSVIFAGFFLQGVYATIVRTAVCTFLGVPLPLLYIIMVIDGCWGALIHVSEEVWQSGQFGGALGRLILNPIHHRIHHASNPEYIDKNYCNTLPIWDYVFGTLQHRLPSVDPKYGLARTVKAGSVADAYFGDIFLLVADVRRAPTVTSKLKTIFMPPGWSDANGILAPSIRPTAPQEHGTR